MINCPKTFFCSFSLFFFCKKGILFFILLKIPLKKLLFGIPQPTKSKLAFSKK